MDDQDLSNRVSELEKRAALDELRDEHRSIFDKELYQAVQTLTREVCELKSWKLRLQYPFAIVGILFIGACTALGAYLVRLFTGE
jgi:hypothetical protein